MANVRQSFTKREYFLQSTVVGHIGFHMGNRGSAEMWLLLEAQSTIEQVIRPFLQFLYEIFSSFFREIYSPFHPPCRHLPSPLLSPIPDSLCIS